MPHLDTTLYEQSLLCRKKEALDIAKAVLNGAPDKFSPSKEQRLSATGQMRIQSTASIKKFRAMVKEAEFLLWLNGWMFTPTIRKVRNTYIISGECLRGTKEEYEQTIRDFSVLLRPDESE